MENVILGDRYQLHELIGVGGMAKVYKATDKLLQRQVAVKVLKDQYAEDEDFLKKFSNEAQSAAKLSHVNIVSVYDIGQDIINDKKVYYIVMQFVEGETLKDLIDKEKNLSNHDLIDFSVQIAQALKSAHSYHIVHRDIKPQNILIDKYGLLKVTDFGIARVSTNATITYTSSILGTVHYISPEQAKGKFVDEKSDLYSLGVVMYEMATGKVPFDADNSVGIAIMHIQDEPVRPKELNPNLTDHLDRIIMKLLSKDPINRFSNAKELIDALEDENYVFDEEIIEKETVKIPIVEDKDSSDETQLINIDKEEIKKEPLYVKQDEQKADEEDEEEKKEAVYVSPSDNKVEQKKSKRKKSSLLPLVAIAVLLVLAVSYFFKRDKSEMIDVPALVDLTEEEAISELQARGLKSNVSRYAESQDYEKGKVMEQDPLPKTEVEPGTTVNIVISQGREVQVPDLSGMTLIEAEDALKEVGLSIGKTKTEYSDSVGKDLVISQKPESDEKVQADEQVDLVVSLGQKEPDISLIKVPNVLGQSEGNARTLLDNNNMKANVSYEYSDDVGENLVISQSIAAGTQVAEGSEMNIVVSRGKDPAKEEEEKNEENDEKPVVDAQFNLDPPEGKDSFNVKIYKVEEDGSTSDLLYNQNHNADEVGEEGKITLNFRAMLGTKVQIRYDDEPIGDYEVQK